MLLLTQASSFPFGVVVPAPAPIFVLEPFYPSSSPASIFCPVAFFLPRYTPRAPAAVAPKEPAAVGARLVSSPTPEQPPAPGMRRVRSSPAAGGTGAIAEPGAARSGPRRGPEAPNSPNTSCEKVTSADQ